MKISKDLFESFQFLTKFSGAKYEIANVNCDSCQESQALISSNNQQQRDNSNVLNTNASEGDLKETKNHKKVEQNKLESESLHAKSQSSLAVESRRECEKGSCEKEKGVACVNSSCPADIDSVVSIQSETNLRSAKKNRLMQMCNSFFSIANSNKSEVSTFVCALLSANFHLKLSG